MEENEKVTVTIQKSKGETLEELLEAILTGLNDNFICVEKIEYKNRKVFDARTGFVEMEVKEYKHE